jgi:hypothetical protein
MGRSMNNELKRMWKEATAAFINVLSRHLTEETDSNNGKPQPG